MDDNMSYEMADEFGPEKGPKKKHTFLKFFITLLIGIIIGSSATGYFLVEVYNPFEKKEKVVKKEETKEEKQELDVESYLVSSLVDRLHSNESFENEMQLYASKKVDADVLDKNYVDTLMVNEAKRENIGKDEDLTPDIFKKALETIFGNNTSFVVPEEDFGECPKYTYDKEKGIFKESSTECKTDDTKTIERTTTKAVLTKDKLEITEAVAFLNTQDKKVYTKVDANGELSEEVEDYDIDNFLIKRDEDKVNKYKYTFIYDEETGNYIFESISLEK